MKRRILAITAALLLFGGIVSADGLNATYNGKTVVKMQSSGKDLIMGDVPAYIDEGGRTMVPVYMLRQLGMQVTYDGATNTVDVKQPHQFTDAELAEISKSVGIVYMYDSQGKVTGQGSGFVIDSGKGYNVFVTNHHVAELGTRMEITIGGEKHVNPVKLFDNEKTDVYGAKIEYYNPIKYDAKVPLLGTVVTAIGYPKEKYQVSNGWIGSITENNGIKLVGFSGHIDHGSSGGILVDDSGRVLAVTTAKIDNINADVSVSTPLKYVQDEIDKLK